jgi:RHS repeat-associated protein
LAFVLADQDGYLINEDGTHNVWHQRRFDLTSYAGKTIANTVLLLEGCTTAGNSWDIYFEDMAIVSTDGTVRPIYNGQSTISFSLSGSSGIVNPSYEVNRSAALGDSTNTLNTTRYYHGDHLGSARLQTAGGGWPIQAATYLPFGQEWNPQITVNHYKFTGDERDAESGLDHTQFRQYSSQLGRWIHPDPAGLAAVDPANPQSWNRYAYVLNSPMGLIDPTGLTTCDVNGNNCYDSVTVTAGSDDSGDLLGLLFQSFISLIDPPAPPLINRSGADHGPINSGGTSVNKPYRTGPIACSANASGLIGQVESNFAQFGNYVGNFGPLGVPAATAAVSFGTGPVTQGSTIPITNVNLVANPFNGPTYVSTVSFNVSVTVSSASPTSFSFTTNPGHVLYPASISFSAADAGPNQINFSINVAGNFAGIGAQVGYYAGGNNLENNIWNHLLSNVQRACSGQPTKTN